MTEIRDMTKLESPVGNNKTFEQYKLVAAIPIDPDLNLCLDFKGFMPAHKIEEKAGITRSIVRDGMCREPMHVWRDVSRDRVVLLDGYTRLEICRENNLPLPKVIYIDLPNQDAACMYVIDQQLDRRNLGSWWIAYFRGLKFNSEKLAPHRPGADERPQNEGVKGRTAESIAEQTGVSRATVERNAKFAEYIDKLKAEVSPEFGAKILNRGFRKLSMDDIGKLADFAGDIRAIAAAFESNPKLTLKEAKVHVQPKKAESSAAQDDNQDSGDKNRVEAASESYDGIKSLISPESDNQDKEYENSDDKTASSDEKLQTFKKNLERDRELLLAIDQVRDTNEIPNLRKTAESIIEKLDELLANPSC